ncbi:NepR family anti-sigma factor [Roseomonas sp. WA12]
MNGNGRGQAAPDSAFDLWLQRGLHQMFDDVMREPIPDELLRLIEQDRGQG